MGLKQWYPDDLMWKAIELWEEGCGISAIAEKLNMSERRIEAHLRTWGYTKYARKRLSFELACNSKRHLLDKLRY